MATSRHRARRRRRFTLITARVAVAFVSVLLIGIMAFWPDRPPRAEPPTRWVPYAVAEHRLEGFLPETWQLALTPQTADARELMTAATFYTGEPRGEACGRLPVDAIATMDAKDALVSIQAKGKPRRMDDLERTVRRCVPSGRGLRASEVRFAEGGRALIVLGKEADLSTVLLAGTILERAKLRPV